MVVCEHLVVHSPSGASATYMLDKLPGTVLGVKNWIDGLANSLKRSIVSLSVDWI